MSWWKSNPKKPTFPAAGLLLLGAVCWGEIRVTSIAYDTARLPCSFHFIQGVEHLLVVWEKVGKDGKSAQVYKSVNGQNDLSNQDSQFRGRTVFSGDVSQGKLDLTLVGVTRNDDAVYFCRAANKINHGDNEVVLSVSALPPLMVQKAVEDDVTLVPKFSGVPTEINWKLNNNKLVDMELEPPQRHFYRLADRAELQRNGSLTIRKLTKEDSGAYKSEVIVNSFIQETEIRLAVLDRVPKPTITNSSTDQRINLHCVSSTINVTYKWLVNGRETETTDQEYVAPRPKENVTLSCTVNNTVSEDSQSRTVPSGKSDRVSKPTITDRSTGQRINLHCVSSTINVTYKWLVNERETETTDQEYIAPRPKENVTLSCTVNNTVSEDSQSKSEYGSLLYIAIICATLPIIMCFIHLYNRRWIFKKYKRTFLLKKKKYEREAVESDAGFQKTEEDQRDAAELEFTGRLQPKYDLVVHHTPKLSSDSDYFSDQSKEAPESECVLEGFQKTEEDQRDAAELEFTGRLQPKHDLVVHHTPKLSSDSDYFSDQSKEAPESECVLEGSQKTQSDQKDDPKYIVNVQSDGYLKFQKTSSDGDYISKKSKESPEPFHVIEER